MMTVHESDVKRAMKILHFICNEGDAGCFDGKCPLRGFCRGYMRNDDTTAFAVLENPEITEELIDMLTEHELVKKG